MKNILEFVFLAKTDVETIKYLSWTDLSDYFVCVCVFPPLLFQGEEEVEMSSTELLYQGILPSLPQYMVSFLCWLIYAEFSQVFFLSLFFLIWQTKRQKHNCQLQVCHDTNKLFLI